MTERFGNALAVALLVAGLLAAPAAFDGVRAQQQDTGQDEQTAESDEQTTQESKKEAKRRARQERIDAYL